MPDVERFECMGRIEMDIRKECLYEINGSETIQNAMNQAETWMLYHILSAAIKRIQSRARENLQSVKLHTW